MYRQLTDQAERYLRSLYQQDDIAAQLKRKLAELMACGEANADAACRALKLSRRTLAAPPQGRTHQLPEESCKEVRAELAINYLRDARLKSLEIAMLLGYSNISTFTTAFKSWYNVAARRIPTEVLGNLVAVCLFVGGRPGGRQPKRSDDRRIPLRTPRARGALALSPLGGARSYKRTKGTATPRSEW